MKKISIFARITAWTSRHKVWTTVIVLILAGGGYYIYTKTKAANAATQYVLTAAHLGTITQTVTGSGQVSAENQLDITSEVSGTILTVNASVGQRVKAGDLIATIDSKDAAIDLEAARIAYTKLTQTAKQGDLTNANNSVVKAYNDGFEAASNLYLHLPSIMQSAKDMLYGRNGFLSDQTTSYLSSTARDYRSTAGASYDKAVDQYAIALNEFKSLTRASATSSIDTLLADSMAVAKTVATALQNMQNTVTFIVNTQPEYNASGATAAGTSLVSWVGTINNDVSALVSAQNTISSTKNSLQTLVDGADTLDVQSQRLSLTQKERTYAKYFIRAPFDGVIGRIPVSVYDKAGSGTVIATVASDRKVTTISLNEVDAVKVQKGNRATLTFDALSGVTIDGEVVQVDLIGTASQGVVTYNIKIAFDGSDPRIRTGMSVDATIVTEERAGVLVIPSTAVKGTGLRKYVEIVDESTTVSDTSSTVSTTRDISSRRFASTTMMRTYTASSSVQTGEVDTATSAAAYRQSAGRTITVSSKTAPRQQPVTIGATDDTNTEILSGISAGDRVVLRTVTTSTTAQSSTPTIFGSLGGSSQRASGGTVRAISR